MSDRREAGAEDRRAAFLEELLRSTPINRRALIQRAAALGLVGPAALRFAGVAAQGATSTTGGGGTMIATVAGDPLTFNPDFQVDDNAATPAANIFNMLVTLDGNYGVLPELAKEWQVAEDGLSITFSLVD